MQDHDFAEMTCPVCVERLSFLHIYAKHCNDDDGEEAVDDTVMMN